MSSAVQDSTPLMKQYFELKEHHPDALMLFQVGDFYELFFEDAKKASAALGIALTTRGKNKGEPIPLCGVPVHALDHYLVKLIKAGFHVAICDQLEAPKPGSVVKRGVTQVLTPGTLTDTKLLDEKAASYLFSFFPMQDSWGLLFGELLTAQLFATVLPNDAEKSLEAELIRFFPDEILLPVDSTETKPFISFFAQRGYVTTLCAPYMQESPESMVADTWLQEHFPHQATIVREKKSLHAAVQLFYQYLSKNQQRALGQFHSLHLYQPDDFLLLDAATQRNLELIKNLQDGTTRHTLFSLVDRAATAMGSRMVKKWLLRPLVKKEQIMHRHDAVALFVQDISFANTVDQLLSHVGDIERVVGRIALSRATLHDYTMLLNALTIIPQLKMTVQYKSTTGLCQVIGQSMGDFSRVRHLLEAALNTDATKPWIIRPGFDERLDQLRDLIEHANQKIIELERQEQQATGINSLKIRYNQAHGYAIEITNANLDAVPEYYVRKQTLVGKERFMISALDALQADIENARTEIEQVENAIYERIKAEVNSYVSDLRKLAHALSTLDALLSFGKISYAQGYVRPHFTTEPGILIEKGRHPVIEQTLAHSFIPNDTCLTQEESLWIITGPNMGGKSTYLRQVALICIMAHCGLFVPAQRAVLAPLDRIFTRIGAGDNLAEGKSTFLVEMEETALICTQATKNSLVILDEVGRGTSTFDGLAIAQAVVEYLHQVVKPNCLFATHYHELTLLQEQFPGIVNYYAASKKTAQGILFLYTMKRGVADGSFGVQVAKLAQLPAAVIDRAEYILTVLSHTEHAQSVALRSVMGEHVRTLEKGEKNSGKQLSFGGMQEATGDMSIIADLEQLRRENVRLKKEYAALQQELADLARHKKSLAALAELDVETVSPKQAFDLLWRLKESGD
jgi:DNA mismatch repair protein MutS